MPIANIENAPTIKPCNNCQAGIMHMRYLVYFTWLGDELISVPNFPAWVCDMCGRREYDAQAVNQINLLLNPNAGKPTRKRPPAHPKPHVTKGPRPVPD